MKSLYTHPARAPRMRRPEQLLQIAIFNFLRPLMAAQKNKYFYCFHPSNGGYRTPAEGRIFKSMGVMAGVADIVILFNGGRAAFIEIKTPSGRSSESQKMFGEIMAQLGFSYIVLSAADASEAINKIVEVLKENGVPI